MLGAYTLMVCIAERIAGHIAEHLLYVKTHHRTFTVRENTSVKHIERKKLLWIRNETQQMYQFALPGVYCTPSLMGERPNTFSLRITEQQGSGAGTLWAVWHPTSAHVQHTLSTHHVARTQHAPHHVPLHVTPHLHARHHA